MAARPPDLVEGVEVVHGPLPVGEEGVLVHLDVRRPPAVEINSTGLSDEKPRHVTTGWPAMVHSLAPPQLLRRGLVLDNALVPGRAAGLGAGQRRQRAGGRDERPLLVLDRLLVQLCFFFQQHQRAKLASLDSEINVLVSESTFFSF
jgi:hypothetical protein